MNNNLSDNLKRIRKDNNLSQEQLSEKLGVSRQSISKWESNQAYPEMDKILQICNIFSVNIDDLLNGDIHESKKTIESKNTINKYLDDFLKFITDTVDLLSSMTFSSKIKCLFEQLVLGFIIFLLFSFIGHIFGEFFYSIFNGLPDKIYDLLYGLFGGVYSLIGLIIGIIILVHIFKTRYLNYFKELKQSNNKKNIEDEKEIKEENEQKTQAKIKEDKIIIRDSQNSKYGFIDGLYKCLILFVKFIVIWIAFFAACSLIGSVCALVMTFFIAKTGALFIGLLLLCLSAIIFLLALLDLLINFIFDRKSNIKILVITFFTSLLICGSGIGLFVHGLTDFEYIDNPREYEQFVRKEDIIPMSDDLLINDYYIAQQIDYEEESRNDVRVEYITWKNQELSLRKEAHNSYYFSISYNENFFEIIREALKMINNKTIIDFDYENITIYASKENINKLKNNLETFRKDRNYYDDVD